jgi:hypothetical protein
MSNLLSNKSYEELELASLTIGVNAHKNSQSFLDEGRKAIYSKCFLKHKLTCKTNLEAEHKS